MVTLYDIQVLGLGIGVIAGVVATFLGWTPTLF